MIILRAFRRITSLTEIHLKKIGKYPNASSQLPFTYCLVYDAAREIQESEKQTK